MTMTFTEGRTDEIMTYSGIVFRPLEPDMELILVEDIAHALANSCRFTGHVREFYSVAEHSVHVAHLLQGLMTPELALWGLLHDASEAYLSDLARPIKNQEGLGEVYHAAEDRLMEEVARAFHLPWPMPDAVKWADEVLLRAEQRDLMPGDYSAWKELADFWPDEIHPWEPYEAELNYLDLFDELTD